jgi:hypothetical protein
MSLKNNPFYIRYQNKVGLPISDALLSKFMGTDSESRQATEFLEWFDKELKKPHDRKKK